MRAGRRTRRTTDPICGVPVRVRRLPGGRCVVFPGRRPEHVWPLGRLWFGRRSSLAPTQQLTPSRSRPACRLVWWCRRPDPGLRGPTPRPASGPSGLQSPGESGTDGRASTQQAHQHPRRSPDGELPPAPACQRGSPRHACIGQMVNGFPVAVGRMGAQRSFLCGKPGTAFRLLDSTYTGVQDDA